MSTYCYLCKASTKRAGCMQDRPRPACFNNDASWLDWNKHACTSKLKNGSFCTDCTQPYQAEMIRAHRCENPGTTFHVRRYNRLRIEGDRRRVYVEHETVGLAPWQSEEEEAQEHAR